MRITWDSPGDRYYKSGVDHGVLYPLVGDQYVGGVAWNGLTEVSPAVNGYETTPLYTGHVKRSSLRSNAEFGGSISAYTYPDEFERCMGSIESDIVPGMYVGQQDRQTFGLCYRTKIGNDIDGIDHGYELHLIYGCVIDSISSDSSTLSSDPEATEFSWDYSCDPVEFSGYQPTSELILRSTKINKRQLSTLEDILYGTTEETPKLPTPSEIVSLFISEVPGPEPRYYSGYPEVDLYEDNDLYPQPTDYVPPVTTGVSVSLSPEGVLTIATDAPIGSNEWVNANLQADGSNHILDMEHGQMGADTITSATLVPVPGTSDHILELNKEG